MIKKILVVDDSHLVRKVVGDALQDNNYTVDVASCGGECLEKIAHNEYDLAIIDYLMPDMNGLEVFKEMNNRKYDLPVLMLTGEGSESVAAEAMKLGVLDYVIKKDNYSEAVIKIFNETASVCENILEVRRLKREIQEGVKKEGQRPELPAKNRVLVVDDSYLVRMMVVDALRDNKFEVDAASCGSECLEKIARNEYDLAVVDYQMPDMSGLEVLKEINNRKLELPVIMLTGEGSEEIAVQAMKLGAMDYATKDIGYIQILPDIVRDNLYIYTTMAKLAGREKEKKEIVKVKERILIVDDSLTARESLKCLLISEEYEVDTASCGSECLEKIAHSKYDLAVIDYHMPDMNGLEVLTQIYTMKLELPVIMLTGKGSEEVAVQAMKLGALDYVIKAAGYLELVPENIRRNLKIFEMKREKVNLEHKLYRKNKELENRIHQLRVLSEISKEIEENVDLKSTLAVIVSKISELLSCARVTIMLIDKQRKYLTIKAAKGFPDEKIEKVKVKMGEHISGHVAASGEAVFIPNIEEDARFMKRNEEQYFTKSLICVPLKIRDSVIGVINVNNKHSNETFTIDEKDILMTIAYNAAIAIEKSKYYEELKMAGVTDHLTGLYNRRHFYDVLDMEIEKAKRYKTYFSLVLIDIDDFKKINDSYGHQQGDEVLMGISRLISQSIRKPDILSRYGGDEFTLFLPQTTVDEAAALLERIKSAVERHSFSSDILNDLKLTVSLGVVGYEKEMALEELLECVDKALYMAKQKGKNNYFIFSRDM